MLLSNNSVTLNQQFGHEAMDCAECNTIHDTHVSLGGAGEGAAAAAASSAGEPLTKLKGHPSLRIWHSMHLLCIFSTAGFWLVAGILK